MQTWLFVCVVVFKSIFLPLLEVLTVESGLKPETLCFVLTGCTINTYVLYISHVWSQKVTDNLSFVTFCFFAAIVTIFAFLGKNMM